MNSSVRKWVDQVAELTRPASIVYCDGTEAERLRITRECLQAGELIELNQAKLPGCYLHRSAPDDVARTEHLTFVCTAHESDAGPNNNWMSPESAKATLRPLFAGSMQGRTMFVVPFLMGPPGSKFSKVGVEVTDSRYVVLNMRIMTRIGAPALDHLGDQDDFTRCLHSLGDLSPERRFIMHFPEENAVWSVGSGYGGNALLGKKCMALRLASWLARKEGWLAEHMLIVGLKNPEGHLHYIAGAFPSACGKTNLAMLQPPAGMPGWEVSTLGDDIAWLRRGDDGRLWAINPEAGFFGVVPGTSWATNPTAFDMIQRNTIYTNVALRPDGTPWWEGHDDPAPPEALDWQGRPWTPASSSPAAHPNSRFTTPAAECGSLSAEYDNPEGVPISAIIFGARRQRRVPLVTEAVDWQHGTFLGATLSSETTAAASGQVGVLRRDPMAMAPFCGYNMGEFLGHWLEVGRTLSHPPKLFRVNWFRTDQLGRYLWPGFGDNLRVLSWIVQRCEGRGGERETSIGLLPAPGALDLYGVTISETTLEELLRVDPADWVEAVAAQREYLASFGDRTPPEIWDEHNKLARRIGEAITPPELRGRDLGTG